MKMRDFIKLTVRNNAINLKTEMKRNMFSLFLEF